MRTKNGCTATPGIAPGARRIPSPRAPLTTNEYGAFDAADVDTARPHPARIDDYLLGGRDNYEQDRDAAEQIKTALPDAPMVVRANRAFLTSAVRALAARGVYQLLDIGAGLPRGPGTLDAIRTPGRAARAVLVDNDPIVVAHLQDRVRRTDPLLSAAAIYGDLRWPAQILRDPQLVETLDLDAPIGVVLGAVLQHLTDDEQPWQAVCRLMEAMPSGSHLVITHATGDFAPRRSQEWAAAYRCATSPLVPRPHARIAAFFDGLDLLHPGLAQLTAPEHPVDGTPRIWMYGGIGRKP